MSVRDEGFLLDMLQAAQRASTELRGVTQEQFYENRLLHTYVAHQIQIIGEAATQVSTEFQASQPQIDWAKITGMRHRIVHGYRDIDLDVVWATARDDLPRLTVLLEPLVPPEGPD